jgi:hypothetical protein
MPDGFCWLAAGEVVVAVGEVVVAVAGGKFTTVVPVVPVVAAVSVRGGGGSTA